VTIAEAQRTISIEGVTYEVRRLNVRDTFAVARIMSVALARSGELASGDISPQRAGMMFFASIPYAEDEAMKLLASLIGVTSEELAVMEPEVIPNIIECVAEGSDLRSFLQACGRVMRNTTISGALPTP